MAAQPDIDDDEIVLRANYVFGYLNPPVKCSSVDEIKLSQFISIYQLLTGEEIPGSISISMKTERAKLTICQFMINSLADDILELPLDHITSNGVVERDRRVLKDLFDVFIQMLEVSQHDLDNVSENTVTTDNEDILVIPPRIREALREIHCGASQLVEKLLQLLSVESQVQCTQTTPAYLKSSSTSPVTWKTLLLDYKDEATDLKSSKVDLPDLCASQHKINNVSSSHPCQRAKISRKALGSISNVVSVRTTTGKKKHVISTKLKKTSPVPIQRKQNMLRSSVKSTTDLKSSKVDLSDLCASQHKINNVSSSHPCQRAKISRKAPGSISNVVSVRTTTGKQKHVISTKLKKTSPVPIQRKQNMLRSSVKSTKLKSDKRNTENYNIRMSLSLVGELEKVRNRQKEITQQIHQLQSEEQRLKTVESILIKELKFSISRDAKKSKQGTMMKPKTTIKIKPLNFRI